MYDQFGDLLLFWRDDEGVRDLGDRGKVEEAARRLWVAGGGAWVDEMAVIRMGEGDEKGKGKGVEMGVEVMYAVLG